MSARRRGPGIMGREEEVERFACAGVEGEVGQVNRASGASGGSVLTAPASAAYLRRPTMRSRGAPRRASDVRPQQETIFHALKKTYCDGDDSAS